MKQRYGRLRYTALCWRLMVRPSNPQTLTLMPTIWSQPPLYMELSWRLVFTPDKLYQPQGLGSPLSPESMMNSGLLMT